MRIRITFHKTSAMRYTSHLDLHRAWERTFRRARLPLAYSQGFHPQPKLNLACPLPLGFTSECEILDAWLEDEVSRDEIKISLQQAAPPGLSIQSVVEADMRAPALQTQVLSAEYTLTLLDPIPDLDERLEKMLEAQALPRLRRGKNYDLRPLIEDIRSLPNDDHGLARLTMRMAARESASGRPEEVLDVLSIEIQSVRVHRSRLFFQRDQG